MNRVNVDDLRRAFDDSFALPADGARVDRAAYLAVRAGGLALALPVVELRGLEKRRAVVPLPGARPGLLGVTAVRGQLVAAYALAALVGGEAGGTPAWLALAAGVDPVGLAFDELIGLFDISRNELRPAGDSAPAGAQSVMTAGGATCWVLRIPQLMERLAGEEPRP